MTSEKPGIKSLNQLNLIVKDYAYQPGRTGKFPQTTLANH
jgi:hypothetical protein